MEDNSVEILNSNLSKANYLGVNLANEKGGRAKEKQDSSDKKNCQVEISNDFREYLAYQDLGNSGAQFYYAFSDEPISQWNELDKTLLPKDLITHLSEVHNRRQVEKNESLREKQFKKRMPKRLKERLFQKFIPREKRADPNRDENLARTPPIFRKGVRGPYKKWKLEEFGLPKDEKFYRPGAVFRNLQYDPANREGRVQMQDIKHIPVTPERRKSVIPVSDKSRGDLEQELSQQSDSIEVSFDRSYRKMMERQRQNVQERLITAAQIPGVSRSRIQARLEYLIAKEPKPVVQPVDIDEEVEPEPISYEKFVWQEISEIFVDDSGVLPSDEMIDDMEYDSDELSEFVKNAREDQELSDGLLKEEEMKHSDIFAEDQIAEPQHESLKFNASLLAQELTPPKGESYWERILKKYGLQSPSPANLPRRYERAIDRLEHGQPVESIFEAIVSDNDERAQPIDRESESESMKDLKERYFRIIGGRNLPQISAHDEDLMYPTEFKQFQFPPHLLDEILREPLLHSPLLKSPLKLLNALELYEQQLNAEEEARRAVADATEAETILRSYEMITDDIFADESSVSSSPAHARGHRSRSRTADRTPTRLDKSKLEIQRDEAGKIIPGPLAVHSEYRPDIQAHIPVHHLSEESIELVETSDAEEEEATEAAEQSDERSYLSDNELQYSDLFGQARVMSPRRLLSPARQAIVEAREQTKAATELINKYRMLLGLPQDYAVVEPNVFVGEDDLMYPTRFQRFSHSRQIIDDPIASPAAQRAPLVHYEEPVPVDPLQSFEEQLDEMESSESSASALSSQEMEFSEFDDDHIAEPIPVRDMSMPTARETVRQSQQYPHPLFIKPTVQRPDIAALLPAEYVEEVSMPTGSIEMSTDDENILSSREMITDDRFGDEAIMMPEQLVSPGRFAMQTARKQSHAVKIFMQRYRGGVMSESSARSTDLDDQSLMYPREFRQFDEREAIIDKSIGDDQLPQPLIKSPQPKRNVIEEYEEKLRQELVVEVDQTTDKSILTSGDMATDDLFDNEAVREPERNNALEHSEEITVSDDSFHRRYPHPLTVRSSYRADQQVYYGVEQLDEESQPDLEGTARESSAEEQDFDYRTPERAPPDHSRLSEDDMSDNEMFSQHRIMSPRHLLSPTTRVIQLAERQTLELRRLKRKLANFIEDMESTLESERSHRLQRVQEQSQREQISQSSASSFHAASRVSIQQIWTQWEQQVDASEYISYTSGDELLSEEMDIGDQFDEENITEPERVSQMGLPRGLPEQSPVIQMPQRPVKYRPDIRNLLPVDHLDEETEPSLVENEPYEVPSYTVPERSRAEDSILTEGDMSTDDMFTGSNILSPREILSQSHRISRLVQAQSRDIQSLKRKYLRHRGLPSEESVEQEQPSSTVQSFREETYENEVNVVLPPGLIVTPERVIREFDERLDDLLFEQRQRDFSDAASALESDEMDTDDQFGSDKIAEPERVESVTSAPVPVISAQERNPPGRRTINYLTSPSKVRPDYRHYIPCDDLSETSMPSIEVYATPQPAIPQINVIPPSSESSLLEEEDMPSDLDEIDEGEYPFDFLEPIEFIDYRQETQIIDRSIGSPQKSPLIKAPGKRDYLKFDDSIGPPKLPKSPGSPGIVQFVGEHPALMVPKRKVDRKRFEQEKRKMVEQDFGIGAEDIPDQNLLDVSPPAPLQYEDSSDEHTPLGKLPKTVTPKTKSSKKVKRGRHMSTPATEQRGDLFQRIAQGTIPHVRPSIHLSPTTRIKEIIKQLPRFEGKRVQIGPDKFTHITTVVPDPMLDDEDILLSESLLSGESLNILVDGPLARALLIPRLSLLGDESSPSRVKSPAGARSPEMKGNFDWLGNYKPFAQQLGEPIRKKMERKEKKETAQPKMDERRKRKPDLPAAARGHTKPREQMEKPSAKEEERQAQRTGAKPKERARTPDQPQKKQFLDVPRSTQAPPANTKSVQTPRSSKKFEEKPEPPKSSRKVPPKSVQTPRTERKPKEQKEQPKSDRKTSQKYVQTPQTDRKQKQRKEKGTSEQEISPRTSKTKVVMRETPTAIIKETTSVEKTPGKLVISKTTVSRNKSNK